MKSLQELKVKLFADGANLSSMRKIYSEGIVKGFTTNPTLMKKAGISDYEAFAKEVLAEIKDLPICFEVLSDDFDKMEYEARKISSWGSNVYVKIPVTNTKGESSIPLIKKLSEDGLSLNITAILSYEQFKQAADVMSNDVKGIISIFAGRIADTGRDPVPVISAAVLHLKSKPNIELLWASSRELYNIYQADQCGCHIITLTDDIFKKLHLIGKDLEELSLETVKMFDTDARAAGFTIN